LLCVIVAIVIVVDNSNDLENEDLEDEDLEDEEEKEDLDKMINIYEKMLLMKLRSDLYYNKLNQNNTQTCIQQKQIDTISSPIPILYKKYM
jgi:hypothetical protein